MAASHLEVEFAARLREAGLEAGAVAEYKFHAGRKWRFDFAYPAMKIAVEIEGGTWSGGRHTRGSGYAEDANKYNHAAIDGWMVLRGDGGMIKSGALVRAVKAAIDARRVAVDGDAPGWLSGDGELLGDVDVVEEPASVEWD
jgi:very-short-patch-repair endonuclease